MYNFYIKNYKALLRENYFKKLNNWRVYHVHRFKDAILLILLILHKFIYRFNAILVKATAGRLFVEIDELVSKFT